MPDNSGMLDEAVPELGCGCVLVPGKGGESPQQRLPQACSPTQDEGGKQHAEPPMSLECQAKHLQRHTL